MISIIKDKFSVQEGFIISLQGVIGIYPLVTMVEISENIWINPVFNGAFVYTSNGFEQRRKTKSSKELIEMYVKEEDKEELREIFKTIGYGR